jgi:hypothetical protein
MSGITESQIQLGLALFEIVQRGLATLDAAEAQTPGLKEAIAARHTAAQVDAQKALDEGASRADGG